MEEALKALTIYGAIQLFEESAKGTIAPGKRADFVILNRNPMTCPVEELKNILVEATIKKDKAIYCRG